MADSLYYVDAKYGDDVFRYEYGNLTHAQIHFNDVKDARILRYKNEVLVVLHEYCKGCFKDVRFDWGGAGLE